jgi:hypothetical protein
MARGMQINSRPTRGFSRPGNPWLLLILVPLIGLGAASALSAKTPASKNKDSKSKEFPSFDLVTTTVQERLAANRGYRVGDLLTASTVDPVFGELAKINWKVSDRKDITKLLLPDSDWLARQLTSRGGRQFMRAVSECPGGFDRVDRLRRMPYGQRQLQDLIYSPDGSKIFEYMTTTSGGKNLSKMLTHGVNGANFDKPTGRIYTERQLLKRLKKSYDAAAVRHLSIEPADDSSPTEKPSSAEPDAGKKSKQPESDDPFEKPHG